MFVQFSNGEKRKATHWLSKLVVKLEIINSWQIFVAFFGNSKKKEISTGRSGRMLNFST